MLTILASIATLYVLATVAVALGGPFVERYGWAGTAAAVGVYGALGWYILR